jgi:hypothetical protein
MTTPGGWSGNESGTRVATETSAVRQPPPRPPVVNLGLGDASSAGDTRRMAPIYIGVIALEVVVLLSIWWFQQHFGA